MGASCLCCDRFVDCSPVVLPWSIVQKSVDFTYGIIIDDDVPLPPDLHVPLLTLSRQEEIKVGWIEILRWSDRSTSSLCLRGRGHFFTVRVLRDLRGDGKRRFQLVGGHARC